MSASINNTICQLISKHMDIHGKNRFDVLMQDIENYIEGGTAHNMCELKQKANNKKKKGDLFESFCYLYLQKVLQHDQVWFYKDLPMELKDQFHLPKNDFGIDLISRKGSGYYAIQCKYRRPQEKIQLISWKSLSTFYAMVTKSGPYVKHITMTNVNGCRHIGEKTEKDWSICIGTFRKIDHFDWLKMGCIENPENNGVNLDENAFVPNKEALRNKRLEYFNQTV